MEDLNIKQLTLAVRTIAEEKNLPEETVLSVIEQAIAAAWRRDNGTRDQLVRASLNINNGTAVVSVVKTVVEEVENDANQIGLEEAKEIDPADNKVSNSLFTKVGFTAVATLPDWLYSKGAYKAVGVYRILI